MSLHLPPLRERGTDVGLLAGHFLAEFSRKFQKGFQNVSPEVEGVLRSYRWPGNVRELRNLIERVVLLEEGEALELSHLPGELRRSSGGSRVTLEETISLPTLAQLEADHISEVLKMTDGNKSRAARILGISRQGLIEKLRRLRLAETADRQVS